MPTSSDSAWASKANTLDTAARAAMARWTGGLSPAAGLLAWTDWASHLACAPGKQAELASLAFRQAAQLGRYLLPVTAAQAPDAPLPVTAAMPVKAGANGPITCGAKDSWRPSSGGNRPRRACPAWIPITRSWRPLPRASGWT